MTLSVFQESEGDWRKIKEAIHIHHKRPSLYRGVGHNIPLYLSICHDVTLVPCLDEVMKIKQRALADEDFEMQLKCWKKLVSGFVLGQTPIFCIKPYSITNTVPLRINHMNEHEIMNDD